MRQFNIHEAKTHFSRLVDDVGNGETIVVAKAGKPVAKLVPFDEAPAEPALDRSGTDDKPRLDMRRFGFMKGKIFVPDDFDTAFQDEIIKMFEGEE